MKNTSPNINIDAAVISLSILVYFTLLVFTYFITGNFWKVT